VGEEARTPSSFSASCCCCSPPRPPSPPEFSSEATACSSPGSRFVATLNLAQLRHRHCRRQIPRSGPCPGSRTLSCFPRWWRNLRGLPGPPGWESSTQDRPPSPPCCWCSPGWPGRPCSCRPVVGQLHQAVCRQSWGRARCFVAADVASPRPRPGFVSAVRGVLQCSPFEEQAVCRSLPPPPRGLSCPEG